MVTQPADPPVTGRLVFEHEVKLATPTGFVLPDLAVGTADVVSAPVQTVDLETTYFDSIDLALAMSGISLRHRTGGPGPPWTLKMAPSAVGGGATFQRELTFADAGQTPPQDARDLLHPFLRSRILLPIACLAATRTTLELRTRAQVRLAVVVHDEVTAYRADEPVGQFGEIEVKSDGPSRPAYDLVEQLVEKLVTAGCTRIEPTPKLLRAFGVLSPPGLPRPPARRPGANEQRAARLIGEALAEPAIALFNYDANVRIEDDAEVVHQFRVATRRLRALLRAFAALLDPAWADQLRAELGWLGRLTGPVRDADVLLERFMTRLGGLSDADAALGTDLLMRLSSERGQRHDELMAGLDSSRYDLLLDALARAVAQPRLAVRDTARGDQADLLVNAARRAWHAVCHTVDALGPDAGPADLHEIRLRAKRARYTAEAAAAFRGRPARRLARAAEEAQTILGELHDAVVAEQWLSAAAAQGGGGTAVVAAQLATAERAEIATRMQDWPAQWAAIEATARAAEQRLGELDGRPQQ